MHNQCASANPQRVAEAYYLLICWPDSIAHMMRSLQGLLLPYTQHCILHILCYRSLLQWHLHPGLDAPVSTGWVGLLSCGSAKRRACSTLHRHTANKQQMPGDRKILSFSNHLIIIFMIFIIRKPEIGRMLLSQGYNLELLQVSLAAGHRFQGPQQDHQQCSAHHLLVFSFSRFELKGGNLGLIKKRVQSN